MIPEGMILAAFVVWCFAAGLYILETLIRILSHNGDDK